MATHHSRKSPNIDPAPRDAVAELGRLLREVMELPGGAAVAVPPAPERLVTLAEAAEPSPLGGALPVVVVPGLARVPKTGEICPWTAMTRDEFMEMRTQGIRTDAGEVLLPPFRGWATANEHGIGRAVIHFDVPAMLHYRRQWFAIAAARRDALRAADAGVLEA